MKDLKKIFTKRNSILIILAIIFIFISFILYGRNKGNVFKDEYMQNIFVEDTENEVTIKNNNIKSNELATSKESNISNKVIVVEIKGEVKKPDVYEVNEGSIIKELIEKAGGLTDDANIDNINRADKLKANQLIVIPNKNNENVNSIPASVNNSIVEEGVININTASSSELQKIPGIGESRANSIVEYREKNGGFKSIEEIKNIDGIGDKSFEKIKDKITS